MTDSQATRNVHPNAVDYFRAGSQYGILLTHGFTGSPHDLRDLADRFSETGATVLIKRLAGHGTSPDDLDTKTIADWQRSIDEAAALLGKTCNRLFLVGNSFGGNVLVDYVLRAKVPITGIALLSTPVFTRGEWWKRCLLPLIIPFKKRVKKSWIKHEEQEEVLRCGSYTEIPLKAYREFLKLILISRRQFSQITLPIYLAYSNHDVVIKPDSAEFIYRKVKSTNRKLIWVHDTNHSPLRSEKAQELFRDIIAFSKSVDRTLP